MDDDRGGEVHPGEPYVTLDGSMITELVRPEQSADNHIAPGFHLAVNLDCDTPAQPIEHQCLLCLGKAEFPRRTRMLDRRQR